jgi:hypothetical protein
MVLVPAPAPALTPGDVEATVPKATYGLRRVIQRLAANGLRGRDNDTPESARAQKMLARLLRQRGDTAILQPFTRSGQRGTNLLTVIRGRELPDEYVVVGAHYDHLGTRSDPTGRCHANGTPGGDVCHGATDNAAGTAIVLAVGRAITRLPTAPRRSIVLALWDAEEDGLLGSAHYVETPLVPLEQTVAYVNIDIAGATFAVGAETGGAPLGDPVTAAAAAEHLGVRLVSYIFGQLRSDYANFGGAGVPTVFFGDSSNGCYHTTGDDVRYVDFAKLRLQSRVVFRTVAALAEDDPAPTYQALPGVIATYADAVALDQVFTTALADLALFPSDAQAQIEGTQIAIAGIVADGPALFDNTDVGTLLVAAVNGIAAIEALGCRGF